MHALDHVKVGETELMRFISSLHLQGKVVFNYKFNLSSDTHPKVQPSTGQDNLL